MFTLRTMLKCESTPISALRGESACAVVSLYTPSSSERSSG